MKKIAVFASGGGTDFQSIIDANEREQFCEIEYLVASKPEIGSIARAEKHGIAALIFDKTKFESKDAFYDYVADELKAAGVEYIAPPSTSASTKCTVAPLNFTPYSIAAACTRSP